jgi:hypothetical protein
MAGDGGRLSGATRPGEGHQHQNKLAPATFIPACLEVRMKWFHIAHAGVTLLLVLAVAVLGTFLLTGGVELRRSSGGGSESYQTTLNQGTKARLLVIRGLRPNWEYRVYEGRNIIGRADQQPVDIDLQPQEPEQRVWSSRQHAAITWEAGQMVIEDLASANGTYVNRQRVPPGEKRPLQMGDVIQIGEVQIKVE